MSVNIRHAVTADTEACGRVIYEAFKGIADRHGFPTDFPSAEAVSRIASLLIEHPSVFAVVAAGDGQVVGTSFLDERHPIRGIELVAVDPRIQGRGIGRRLMEAVLERARGAVGIRLVQDAYNTVSISLYASLGFEVKEPLVSMKGKPKSQPSAGAEVRPLTHEDLDECAALCKRVYGFERTHELQDALKQFSPFVAWHKGRITAYTYAMFAWNLAHGVAETEQDMEALILGLGALSSQPLSFLLPTRQASFFRWCLSQGLRVIKPVTLMATGEYQEPKGCYFPSWLY